MVASDPFYGNVDLVNDDVLFNVVTTETMMNRKEDGKPWRGAKEKSDSLLHLLLNSVSRRLSPYFTYKF